MIALRPLTDVSWDTLAGAFNEAFSDYAVPIATTPAALAEMQRRRGYDASISVGAFDGDRLVGFVLTCRDGGRAYNSGTGVVPSHRRTGLARRVLDDVIARLGGCPYVLEVLEDNAKAIAFYRGAGFATTRRLQCWTYDAARELTAPVIAAPALDTIAAHGELEPSWQNTVASIRRASDRHVALGDDRAAIVVFPATGDVPLLAVAAGARRRGHGRRLLEAAAGVAGRPLRLLNLDDRATGIAAFLTAVGAKHVVAQLEMLRIT